MNRKNNCIACRNKEYGVKTRKSFAHTCGKYIKELPPIQEDKQYFLSCDLYDNKYGPGTIMVMSKTKDGKILTVEHFTQTKITDFKKEVERIAKYYNAEAMYDEVTGKFLQSNN